MPDSNPSRTATIRGGAAILLVLAGLLVAGTYGALHNQISYTVSPEYFTVFKFEQFGIDWDAPRLGAAAVGFGASWWMGALIGPPVVALGVAQPTLREQVVRTGQAYGVCATTALLVGLGALAVAFGTVDGRALPRHFVEMGVTDPTAFLRAGAMHNASYVGGLIGIGTGLAFQAYTAFRSHQASQQARDPADPDANAWLGDPRRVGWRLTTSGIGLLVLAPVLWVVAAVSYLSWAYTATEPPWYSVIDVVAFGGAALSLVSGVVLIACGLVVLTVRYGLDRLLQPSQEET